MRTFSSTATAASSILLPQAPAASAQPEEAQAAPSVLMPPAAQQPAASAAGAAPSVDGTMLQFGQLNFGTAAADYSTGFSSFDAAGERWGSCRRACMARRGMH
jgi:hypothetical protein